MSTALQDALTLLQARSAARSGDLDRAAQLLGTVAPPTVAVLDLRARVHAQRGELDRADECWEQALRLDPDHAEARRGRATIARLRRRRPVRAVAIVAAAVVLAAGGVALASSRAEAPMPSATPSATLPPKPGPAPVVVRDTRLTEIARRVTMPGVRTDRRAGDVGLVFTSGLFVSDTRLAHGSPALLRVLGKRLRNAHVTVTVVGHTVPVAGGRTSGGSTTAYARAQIAAQRLSAASGLPLTSFTLATADQSEGPWPEPARNRTVTLLLRPAASP